MGKLYKTTHLTDGIPDYAEIKNNITGDSKKINYENGQIKGVDYKYSVRNPENGINDTRRMMFSRVNGKNVLSYFEADGTNFHPSRGLSLSDEFVSSTRTAKETKYIEPIIKKHLKLWAKMFKI